MPSFKKDGKTQKNTLNFVWRTHQGWKLCIFLGGGIGIWCLEMYKLFVGRGRGRRWPTTKRECVLCVLGRSLCVSVRCTWGEVQKEDNYVQLLLILICLILLMLCWYNACSNVSETISWCQISWWCMSQHNSFFGRMFHHFGTTIFLVSRLYVSAM